VAEPENVENSLVADKVFVSWSQSESQSVYYLVRCIITVSVLFLAVKIVQNHIGLQWKLSMSSVKADKSLKLTQYLSVSLWVRRPHHL